MSKMVEMDDDVPDPSLKDQEPCCRPRLRGGGGGVVHLPNIPFCSMEESRMTGATACCLA